MEKSLSQIFSSKGTRASRPEVAVMIFFSQFKTTYGDEVLGGEQGRVLAKIIYVVVSWSPATADH